MLMSMIDYDVLGEELRRIDKRDDVIATILQGSSGA